MKVLKIFLILLGILIILFSLINVYIILDIIITYYGIPKNEAMTLIPVCRNIAIFSGIVGIVLISIGVKIAKK